MSRTLFVTTALPYANGSFHIGHIMEYIQADIWVRSMRMAGHTVHFVGADDAHGAPIMLKAEKEGITPQALVARYAAERPQYLNGFHIRFDHWHTTDSPENVALSQDIYRALKAQDLIETRSIEQFYDPVKGMFLADRYIKGECPKCHAKGPVRRFLRSLRRGLRPDRPDQPVFGPDRRHAGAEIVGSLLLQAVGSALRRIPAAMDHRQQRQWRQAPAA